MNARASLLADLSLSGTSEVSAVVAGVNSEAVLFSRGAGLRFVGDSLKTLIWTPPWTVRRRGYEDNTALS
jgi:hypothetical protein